MEEEKSAGKFKAFCKSAAEKFKAFMDAHKETWKLVKFILVSLSAFLTQIILLNILQASLKKVNSDFTWWVFSYSKEKGGTGAFVAFLISSIVAQVVAFVVNRKKTFKSTNNLAFSASLYAVMAIGIIIMQTALPAPIINGIDKGIHNNALSSNIALILTSLMAFVITLVCCDLVIMKEWKKKAAPVETAAIGEAAATTEDTGEKAAEKPEETK